MVRGDKGEHFLDYGFSKQNSMILHSFHKKCIPSSFWLPFLTDIVYSTNLVLFKHTTHKSFFSPSTTDTVEEINRHMGSVNLLPIDISEDSFEVENEVAFNPSKLEYENPDKEKLSEAIVKMLRRVVELSNANLIKNVNCLLAKMYILVMILNGWGKKKKRLPDNRSKILY